jgi:8-oxo-dGTP pyrophosphatase MutT (NUDIX family)
MKLKKEVSAGGIIYKKPSSVEASAGKGVLWLTTQHSRHKGWTFPKGLVADTNPNETKEKAALREVKEEGGIEARIVNLQPVKVEYKYTFQEYLIDKTVYYYLMEYVSGDIKDHDWEVSDAKFLSQEEIVKILTYKEDLEAFEKTIKLFERA